MANSAISAQGSTFQIATGSGGAKTLTAIAVGNPTILTATGHGLGNGNAVALAAFTGADAGTLNAQKSSVLFSTTNTFAIAIDTTGKTITATGTPTATPDTYTKVSNFHDFTCFDGSVSDIDVTNLDSTAKEYIPGLVDNGMFSMNMNSDLADAGQIALLAAKVAATVTAFKLTLPNAKVASFNGYVKKFGGASGGGVDAVTKVSCDIKITGPVTWA